MSKLLFSLEDITPTRSFEIIKEQYFVIFGYDPAGKAETLSFEGDNILSSLTGANAKLKQWFFMGVTPIFKIRRKRKHVFPGGLPLYYGHKTDMTSIYLAVVESDQNIRNAGKSLRDFIGKIDTNPLMDAAIKLTTMTQPEAALVKAAFGLTIKAIEEVLIMRIRS